jgi:hypothetical protein
VAVVHCLANERGGTLFEAEDVLKYEDLANMAPDIYLFGHWHKDQGITEFGSKFFVNVGSLSRGSLSQDDLTRKPAAVILKFNSQGFRAERFDLAVRPSNEVFDLAGRAKIEDRKSTMEEMVDNLKAVLTMRQGPSLLDQVRNLPIDDVIREKALAYLEQAGAK